MRLGGRREDISPGVTGINAIRRAFLEIVVEDQQAGLLVVVLRHSVAVPDPYQSLDNTKSYWVLIYRPRDQIGSGERRIGQFLTAKNVYTRSEESGEEVVSGRKSVIWLGGVAFIDIKKAALSQFKVVFLGLRDGHTVFAQDVTGVGWLHYQIHGATYSGREDSLTHVLPCLPPLTNIPVIACPKISMLQMSTVIRIHASGFICAQSLPQGDDR
ncbi:hypothetical protein ARMSODRAFT_978875 [Armillaria solidipes]|uniref:Uncharacterized protein n=1 Tax=Armillaria solidipes TaxID=1076256 RepID=A0A2H3BEY9_9AGAR|nr:hypothetical protein ARMSODRAFT_978875 [Armillaria solidipes]